MPVLIVTCGILVGMLSLAAFTPARAGQWRSRLVGARALSAGTLEEGLVLNLASGCCDPSRLIMSPRRSEFSDRYARMRVMGSYLGVDLHKLCGLESRTSIGA